LAANLFWPETFAAIGFLSMNDAIVLRVGQRSSVPDIAVTASVLALFLSLVTIVVAVALAPTLVQTPLDPAGWIYLVTYIPMNFLGLALLALDQGEMKFTQYNLLRLSVPVTYAVALIGLLLTHSLRPDTALWASLGANLSCTAFRLFIAAPVLSGNFSWEEARSLVGFGLKSHATTLVMLLSSRVDRAFVFSRLDDASAGQYAVALTYAGTALGVLTNTVNTIAFSRAANGINREETVAFVGRTIRMSMLLLSIGSLPLALLSPWVVPGLFGNLFQPSAILSVVLIAAYLPLAMRQIMVRLARGLGDARTGVFVELLATVTFLAAAFPMAGLWGLTGLCAAMFLTNIICFVATAAAIRYTIGITWRECWGLNMRTASEAIHKYAIFLKSRRNVAHN
jgi:O-antigen/teichoic acid export membrane protein